MYPGSMPSESRWFARHSADDRSSHQHRQAIGWLGVLLPLALPALAAVRPVPNQPTWPPLSSVSAYAYTRGSPLLSGALGALAVYLLTYRGFHQKKGGWIDRWLGRVAGLAALGVALFPTEPGDLPRLDWWTDWMGTMHTGSAVLLFACFTVFCLFRFTKSDRKWSAQPTDKQVRSGIFVGCGLGMALALLLAWRAMVQGASIFWHELAALELFGFSWLLKGRIDHTARQWVLVGRVKQRQVLRGAKRLLGGEGRRAS